MRRLTMITNNKSGMTLLEVMISLGILSITIAMAIEALLPAIQANETVSAITSAEGKLHIFMDDLLEQLAECNAQYVWQGSFVEDEFDNPQEILAFLSARDSDGEFQISNGQPVWQSVEVYCPYSYTIQGDTKKVLKKYKYAGVPAAYTGGSFAFTYTITDTEITLPNGVTFERNSDGDPVLSGLDDFDVTGDYPMVLSIQIMADTPGSDVPVVLTSNLATRNKN